MDSMGEFILLTAQERAREKNVAAEGVIRHGYVGEQIISLAKRWDIDRGRLRQVYLKRLVFNSLINISLKRVCKLS